MDLDLAALAALDAHHNSDDLISDTLADPLALIPPPNPLLALHPPAPAPAAPAPTQLGASSVTLADQSALLHHHSPNHRHPAYHPHLPAATDHAFAAAAVMSSASASAALHQPHHHHHHHHHQSAAPAANPYSDLLATLHQHQHQHQQHAAPHPATATATATPTAPPSLTEALLEAHDHPNSMPDLSIKKARTTLKGQGPSSSSSSSSPSASSPPGSSKGARGAAAASAAAAAALLRVRGGAATTAELSTAPEVDAHTVCQMGGLPYAKLCRERAREEFKDAKRNEHLANGNLERTTRRKKNDTSMTAKQKYKRRLGMNQDSAAAARHAQEVYIHVLEKLVKLSESERKTFAVTMARLRAQNALLHHRVDELQTKLAEFETESGEPSAVGDGQQEGQRDKSKEALTSKLLDMIAGAPAVRTNPDLGIQPARAV